MTTLKFIGILLSLLALPMAAAQQDYTAADSIYSLTFPTGWTIEARDPILRFSKDAVRISLLSLPAESEEASITAAFKQLEIRPTALLSETDASLPNGVWKQHIYPKARISISLWRSFAKARR